VSAGRTHAAHRRHVRVAAAATAALALLVLASGPPALAWQVAILALGVVALGLPHGAVDAWGTAGGGPRAEERSLADPRWLLAYAGGAGAALGLALAAPGWFWPAFLGASVLHFGASDVGPLQRARGLDAVSLVVRGALPILLPVAFHPEETAGLLTWVLGVEAAVALAPVALAVRDPLLMAFAVAGGALLGLHAWRAWSARSARDAHVVLEGLVLLAAGAVLPPLLFFTVHFCLWHSLRHMLALALAADPSAPARRLRALWRHGLLLSLLPAALAAAAGMAAGTGALEREGVRVVFTGLAALAVPHLLLWLGRDPAGGTGVASTGAHGVPATGGHTAGAMHLS